MPVNTLIGECPPNTVLLGISGVANDSGANSVRLVNLEPASDTIFRVDAAAASGFNGAWSMTARARCATRPAGYEIVPGNSATSSSTFKEAIARCPGAKRAIGSGAFLNAPGGLREVALQLVRTSGPLDIVRATAREDANGYSNTWSVTAFAICINPVPGQVAAQRVTLGTTAGSVTCPNGTFVHGFGGGGSTTDVTGPVWLRSFTASNQVATASFTGLPNDGIVAAAVCAP
jgi:hypothetical protein